MVEAEVRLPVCSTCECSERIKNVNMEQKTGKKKVFLRLRLNKGRA